MKKRSMPGMNPANVGWLQRKLRLRLQQQDYGPRLSNMDVFLAEAERAQREEERAREQAT